MQRFEKRRASNPKAARKAFAILAEPTSSARRAAPRDRDSFKQSLVKRKASSSIKLKTDLVHWNQFDWIERYTLVFQSEIEAKRMWRVARRGQYPPWTPSTNTAGEPCLAKMEPERLCASTGETNTIKRPRRGSVALPRPAGSSIPHGGAIELLPDTGDVEEENDDDDEESEPAPEAEGRSPGPPAGIQACSERAVAVTPVPKPRRSFPASFQDGDADGASDPLLGNRLPAKAWKRGGLKLASDAPAPAPAEPAAPPSGKKQHQKEIVVTAESLREELAQFDDLIDDPLHFSKVMSMWRKLHEFEIAKNEV